MSFRLCQTLPIAILCMVGPTVTHAASPPPRGSPHPVTGPALRVAPEGAYSFDFHYSARVSGTGFRPGERVQVTAEHVAAAPDTVVAGANGDFNATLAFTWEFCGPNGAAASPPVIVATGSDGSHTQITLRPIPCPEITLTLPLTTSVPGPGGATPGGGVHSGPGVEPGPLPNPRPTPATVWSAQVLGFGFVPGETVQLVERGLPAPPASVAAQADSLGRIRATVRVSIPSFCSGLTTRVWLLATGNRGTSAATLLGSSRPVGTVCPVVGGATGPPDNPPSPSGSVTAGQGAGLQLKKRKVHAGGMQKARTSLPAGTTGAISIRYPGGRDQVVHVRGKARPVTVVWRVPRQLPSGQATAVLTVSSLGLTLEQGFSIG